MPKSGWVLSSLAYMNLSIPISNPVTLSSNSWTSRSIRILCHLRGPASVPLFRTVVLRYSFFSYCSGQCSDYSRGEGVDTSTEYPGPTLSINMLPLTAKYSLDRKTPTVARVEKKLRLFACRLTLRHFKMMSVLVVVCHYFHI